MIKPAGEEMLPRLKEIWRVCFGDSREDTDFVFERLLHPAQMLVQTGDDGLPVAMLSWKLLRFATPRDAFLGAYVFGVATLPAFRGKGIAAALMSELHAILIGEGASLSCLVPASASLFEFYARQGFEKRFSYKKLTVEAGVVPDAAAEGVLSPASLRDMKEPRGRAFAGSALFGDWDTEYLAYTDEECRRLGGETLRFSCRGKTGYVVCYPRGEGTLLVKEAVLDREDMGILISALHARYRARRYELRLPEDYPGRELPNEILPFAMVKWYDEEKRRLIDGAVGTAPWFAFGLD